MLSGRTGSGHRDDDGGEEGVRYRRRAALGAPFGGRFGGFWVTAALLPTAGRVPEPSQRRVLDGAARQRRLCRQLEALERDNFGDDPQAGLPRPGKRLPHFADTAETGGGTGER